MKILVLGASGFFGRNIAQALGRDHEVCAADRAENSRYRVDLTRPPDIARILEAVRPEVLINCAGIVDNSEKANLNPVLTSNLLKSAVASGQKFKRIIISGSAAEYGPVAPKDLPVKETAPLHANSLYGLSKLKETTVALDFRARHQLPVVIARIFNPIGAGMGPRFLTTRILQQVQEVRAGTRTNIEVNRLDSERDLLHIQDAAAAVKAIIEGTPKSSVYNIGSGRSTSNGELIELILRYSNLTSRPQIIETAQNPEAPVASQADISRLEGEFGWRPTRSTYETVKELVDASN